MRIRHNNLPADCTLVFDEYSNRIHIKFHGRYVVSKKNGRKKFIKGNDEKAWKSARLFAWKFRWHQDEKCLLEGEK